MWRRDTQKPILSVLFNTLWFPVYGSQASQKTVYSICFQITEDRLYSVSLSSTVAREMVVETRSGALTFLVTPP